MINIGNTPLYKSIVQYAASQPTVFHMPGHKLGKGMPEGPFRDMGLFDLTEIPGTDNLHFPEGAIQEAQKLAAKAFGADESFFLVNGSTGGIHAVIMTICGPGEKLIVSRDCHKSVINGLLLAGGSPVYIKPGFNEEFGISTGALTSEIAKALEENPEAIGVLITRPNYYGVCCDIDRIAALVHAKGKLLVVDEAHGAHLRFGKGLPRCAMEAGADLCIQSAHKTLPAYTQGAYLHVTGSRVDRERLRFYLRTLQTSSPSYILMASLDIAREVMVSRGAQLLEELEENRRLLEAAVASERKLGMLQKRHMDEQAVLDTTRVVVNVKNTGITGFAMEKMLREQYNIQVEMSDLYNIVCVGTAADDRKDYQLLGKALREISDDLNHLPPLADIHVRELIIPPQKVDMKQLIGRKVKALALKEAEGKISNTLVTPYPPGIPVICPGEIIMADSIEYIYNIGKAGGTVNGLTDRMEIQVVE